MIASILISRSFGSIKIITLGMYLTNNKFIPKIGSLWNYYTAWILRWWWCPLLSHPSQFKRWTIRRTGVYMIITENKLKEKINKLQRWTVRRFWSQGLGLALGGGWQRPCWTWGRRWGWPWWLWWWRHFKAKVRRVLAIFSFFFQTLLMKLVVITRPISVSFLICT